MKKLTHVPSSALSAIQTEHQKALATLGERRTIATLPIREVKMRIDRPTKGRPTLENVIVPKTAIYYHGRSGDDGTYYRRNGLSYYLTTGTKPFPYGHIYESSGSVCLGSIFVPSKISLHTPAQPLEALFLHNDHNVAHGNSKVILSDHQVNKALELLHNEGVTLTTDVRNTFIPNTNLIQNDAIWIVSADVTDQLPIDRALYVMKIFFSILFIDSTNK